ncbi:MAG: hypothetical protein KDC85_05330 [Saprospiraceae bacterium]|nr:hypothetical protein [Saprospiraceae bacterium]MCB9324979.1 hypothetical protein [Lewinellaceae bacterium]
MSENVPYFIVPVDLKAFIFNGVAPSPHDQWKDLGLDYDNIEGLVGSKLEKGGLFSSIRIPSQEVGIHLHWTLPSALTHGIVYKEELNFPAVPNRWLVLRIHSEQDDLKHKAWVIESDYTEDDDWSLNWLSMDEKEGFVSKKIGKVMSFEDWTEPDETRETLTAMAPGNPAFSALYNSCQNVFGFHDKLEHLDKTQKLTFTYLVVGWYSDGQLDPLNPAGKTDKKLWELRLEELKKRWEHPGTWPETGQDTICHSALHEVVWSNNEDKTAPVIKTAVNTVLGNTAVEGLSARLSKQTKADEKLLSAFQYDLLKEVKTRGEIESQVHERGFAPIGGGTVWEIERTDEAKEKEEEKLPPFPDLTFFREAVVKETNEAKKTDEPKEVALEKKALENLAKLKTSFYQLNKDQNSYDEKIRRKNSLQVEFRAAWDRELLDKVAVEKIKESKEIKDVQAEIDSLIKEIEILSDKLGYDHNDGYRYGTSQKEIHELLGYTQEPEKNDKGNLTLNAKGKYRLARKKMPNFWRPQDPALLFYGPGIDDADKYRQEDSNEKVKGRLMEGVIDKVLLRTEKISKEWVSVEDAGLPAFPLAIKPDMPLDVVESLYFEMLLMDQIAAIKMAETFFSTKSGRGTDNDNHKSLGEAIKNFLNPKKPIEAQLQNQLLGFQSADGGSITAKDIFDMGRQKYFASIGQTRWQSPWTPLFMLWEIEWYPDYKKQADSWEFDFSNWEWDKTQYSWKGDVNTENKMVFEGKTLLSNVAEQLLKSKLQGFDKLSQINLLSQSLDGLTDCLLMQKQAIRLPLMEKNEGDKKIRRIENLDQYESKSHYFLPMSDSIKESAPNFFPLRAGHIKIRQLWIVDSFGQIQYVGKRDTLKETTNFSGSLIAASDNQSKAKHLFRLPPRLCQAARLMFRWKSAKHADQDSNSDPSTSPVYGWILYHRIDESLWIYDQEGMALGALFYISDNQPFGWRNAPVKGNETKDQNMEAVVKDETLRLFVQSLQASGKTWGDLKKVLEDLDVSFGKKGQQYSNNLAHQVSQPLALARASVGLESFGLPAYPQTNNATWDEKTQLEARGLQNIKFNLSLGNREHRNDGLVGYFLNDDFEKLNLAHGFEPSKNEYFGAGQIQLGLNAPRLDLTLLIDPRGGVTARTGILPEKFIDLPQEYIQEPLENMELYIQTTPVLSALDELNLPLQQQSRKWSWFFLDEKGKWGHKEAHPGSANNDFKSLGLQEGFLKLEKEGVIIQTQEEEK